MNSLFSLDLSKMNYKEIANWIKCKQFFVKGNNFCRTAKHSNSKVLFKERLKMDIYDFKAEKRNGELLDIADFKGKVLLIVNTATGCGFTPQYEALENLYKKYHEKGLEILDFPCNQFGNHAPGSDEVIHSFCTAKYKTSFDQMKKVDVNGENASAIWNYLKENSPKEYISGFGHKTSMKAIEKISSSYKKENDIKWNFTKFLVDKEGQVVARYSPVESPSAMEDDIIRLLKDVPYNV